MDLIYADRNKIELGVIQDCTFDCAFGSDENNFECSVDMDNHVCQEDYFIYFDETQYGGIIDRVAVSTENHTITYKGRTWHGILNSRVLSPAAGYDYLTLTGEANEVIAEIIKLTNTGNIFTASTEDSGLYIPGYQIRYEYAYTAILKMLTNVNGKLKFKHDGNLVQLRVENIADYYNNEEFHSSQIGFSAEKFYNVSNHFVCLGSGELKDRYVIHLFTNENGEVQPYYNTEKPVSDSDYILDESQKVMVGNEERVYLYECDGAKEVENYVPLQNEPLGWKNSYTNYYVYNSENEQYEKLEKEFEDIYALTKSKPMDWDSNYERFYYFFDDEYKNIKELVNGKSYELITQKPQNWKAEYESYFYLEDGVYKEVSLREKESYTLLKKQPNDWKKNYGDYYYFFTDGVYMEYRSIEGRQKNYYIMQTRRPTDWMENYNNYYELNEKGKYEEVEIKSYKVLTQKPSDWKKNYGQYYDKYSDGIHTEYKQISGKTAYSYSLQNNRPTDWYSNYKSYFKKSDSKYTEVEGIAMEGAKEKVAPAWAANTYYIRVSDTVAPDYEAYSRVYRKAEPPKWKKKRYYTKESRAVTPRFDIYDKVYKRIVTSSIPSWKADTYYDEYIVNNLIWENGKYFALKENQELIPSFVPGEYFKLYIDHYADLVSSAMEQISEIYNCDSIDINLPLEENYDIGDIVGATEAVTGLSIWQPITKKIVKIKDNTENIEYEIGGTK